VFEIKSVSRKSFEERRNDHLENHAGADNPSENADRAATVAMLNEIHFMLRSISPVRKTDR